MGHSFATYVVNGYALRIERRNGMDKNIENIIRQEIERLKQENATMRKQVEQEINRNDIHILALEKLLKEST